MDFSLDGKVAIVTGGAGGSGREYGRPLAAAGAAVVLADLAGPAAGAAAAALEDDGASAIGVEVDVTSEASVEAMAARTLDALGGIDLLVNNAALMAELPQVGLLEFPLRPGRAERDAGLSRLACDWVTGRCVGVGGGWVMRF